jgi:hypothetical protein
MTDPIDHLTLAQAAALYRVTISTLRAEAARGRLVIFRLGRSDYTTRSDLAEMIRRCREDDPRRACTSTAPGEPGASETVAMSSAQAALQMTVEALRNGSLTTSARSTDPSHPRAR